MNNLVNKLKMEQLVFQSKDNQELLYCQRINDTASSEDYSLVIFLHGAGERGNDNAQQLRHVMPDFTKYVEEHQEKTIVIAPQCPENHQWVNTPWSNTSHTIAEQPSVDMQMVMELIDSKLQEFNINKNRIYITGISMGGYGSWDLLARKSDLFTAGIVVCGGADLETAPKLKNIPLQLFHGAIDDIVPPVRSQNMFKALKNAGNNQVNYTEYEGVKHDAWSQTYSNNDILNWLFKQSK